jgi:hypothetical protein
MVRSVRWCGHGCRKLGGGSPRGGDGTRGYGVVSESRMSHRSSPRVSWPHGWGWTEAVSQSAWSRWWYRVGMAYPPARIGGRGGQVDDGGGGRHIDEWQQWVWWGRAGQARGLYRGGGRQHAGGGGTVGYVTWDGERGQQGVDCGRLPCSLNS